MYLFVFFILTIAAFIAGIKYLARKVSGIVEIEHDVKYMFNSVNQSSELQAKVINQEAIIEKLTELNKKSEPVTPPVDKLGLVFVPPETNRDWLFLFTSIGPQWAISMTAGMPTFFFMLINTIGLSWPAIRKHVQTAGGLSIEDAKLDSGLILSAVSIFCDGIGRTQIDESVIDNIKSFDTASFANYLKAVGGDLDDVFDIDKYVLFSGDGK
jgi:hypothetical protein